MSANARFGTSPHPRASNARSLTLKVAIGYMHARAQSHALFVASESTQSQTAATVVLVAKLSAHSSSSHTMTANATFGSRPAPSSV